SGTKGCVPLETCKLNPGTRNTEVGPRNPIWRSAFHGCLTGLLLAMVVQVGQVVLDNNFHAVVPGLVYRSSQLSDSDLEDAIRRHGIRAVVNLRGICAECPWYLNECRATHQGNASQHDIGFSAGRLPPVDELRYLLRVLDRSEYPILVHCRQGIDRTGLVSALVLLLYTDTDLNTARHQLDLRYGHVALGRTAYMRKFFALYEGWLQARGLEHSPPALRRWIEQDYSAGPCRCRLEVLELPKRVPLGKPWAVCVRATNTSAETWRLRPGSNAGVHAGFIMVNGQGLGLAHGKAGLFEAEVPPGQSIDLTVALPAVDAPGPCYLLVDMIDEQQCWFYQNGSKPLTLEVEI